MADVATTTATTTFADADVVAETESGIGMTTDAGLSAETRAQMRAELAALDARRVQRMEAEAARHRFSRVETETEAVVSAYHAMHSPWACTDVSRALPGCFVCFVLLCFVLLVCAARRLPEHVWWCALYCIDRSLRGSPHSTEIWPVS